MSYRVEWHPDGAVLRFYDTVTGADVVSANREMLDDSRFTGARWQIWDLLDIDASEVADLDARMIAKADIVSTKTSGGHPLQAAVVTTSPFLAGLTEKYAEELRAVGWEVQVYDQMEAARAWLRIG